MKTTYTASPTSGASIPLVPPPGAAGLPGPNNIVLLTLEGSVNLGSTSGTVSLAINVNIAGTKTTVWSETISATATVAVNTFQLIQRAWPVGFFLPPNDGNLFEAVLTFPANTSNNFVHVTYDFFGA